MYNQDPAFRWAHVTAQKYGNGLGDEMVTEGWVDISIGGAGVNKHSVEVRHRENVERLHPRTGFHRLWSLTALSSQVPYDSILKLEKEKGEIGTVSYDFASRCATIHRGVQFFWLVFEGSLVNDCAGAQRETQLLLPEGTMQGFER